MSGQSKLFPLTKRGVGKAPAIEDQLAACGFPDHETEYPFAKSVGRNWKADYAWPDHRIALEIEGGAFGRYLVVTAGYERRRGQSIPLKPGTVIRAGGRHNTGEGMQEDCVKYSTAAILGWTVIRATTTMVRDGDALRLLADAFRERAGLTFDVPR